MLRGPPLLRVRPAGAPLLESSLVVSVPSDQRFVSRRGRDVPMSPLLLFGYYNGRREGRSAGLVGWWRARRVVRLVAAMGGAA